MSVIEVPVLIVGGGGCGLSSSLFLSDLGVDHLLVERHPTTSDLPKAHYLNQRTMEIFRQHGIADSVYEVGAPMETFGRVSWCTSLGGHGALDRQTFATMDAFGGRSLTETYSRNGPCLPSNYPLVRLEPLLRRHAEQRAPDGRIRFHHELLDWTEHGDMVSAVVRDHTTGENYTVQARYVIAADGGKTIGTKLGVAMDGEGELLDMASAHFTADLSDWWDSDLISWVLDPEGTDGAAAVVQLGPTWGKHSEEWMVHFPVRADDPSRDDDDAIVSRMLNLLKLPELQLEVHKVSHWILETVLADRYRAGRFFLAGDAAHRHPPATGIGLNTAIQDAHNLAWKVAAVLNGQAHDVLLDSYEAERRPVGMHNMDWAMFSFLNHSVLDAAVGLVPGAPAAMRKAACQAFFADASTGEARRARAAEVITTLRAEFQAHDLELGFAYPEGALVPDGTSAPPRDPLGCAYTPTTRPGHRLPHAWLRYGDKTISTHDLTNTSSCFAFITGAEGAPWDAAAERIATKFGVPINVVRVANDSDYTDPTGSWSTVREIGEDGAVLARPDNHVAFRSAGVADDPDAVLTRVMTSLLAR